MKTKFPSALLSFTMLFLFVFFSGQAQILNQQGDDMDKPETAIPNEIFWHVKAYRPDAKLLDIKAIDKDGNMHDIKAIQDSPDTSILNIKAIVNGNRLPIKLIIQGNNQYYPVKAIDNDGVLMDIKAFTEDGRRLDLKGVSKIGNIVNLRAITNNAVHYNIIAVSPDGAVNDVKGVKMMDDSVETIINSVSIYAHVKALKQN